MEELLIGAPPLQSSAAEPANSEPTEIEQAAFSEEDACRRPAETPPSESSPSTALYDWNEILALAPFASRETLDRLIRQCSHCADWDFILALAPFASRETLDRLVTQCESDCDRNHLHALAPFLDHSTLDRLILQGIGRSTLSKSVARSEAHWEDGLAAWSEVQERQMEAAVSWTEAREKSMEQAAHMEEMIEKQTGAAMRRAERMAERQMERAVRRAERIAEKELERVARHADQAVRRSDERRTQIIAATPACSSLEEYADRIASLLYEFIDPANPGISRVEEIRHALLKQDYGALNEYAQLLDERIGSEWLEEYAALCMDAEIPPDFRQQIDLALTQRNWNWIENHAHLINDLEIIRRIVLVSTTEGFFDFVPLFLDQLDQHSIDSAARQAVRMRQTDDVLSFSHRVSPGILD